MRIINVFFFTLITLPFSLSLANTELAENKDLSFEKTARIISRNQAIIYGDKFKVEGINFSGLIVGELIASDIDQNKSSRFNKKNTYTTFCVPKITLYAVSNLLANILAKSCVVLDCVHHCIDV